MEMMAPEMALEDRRPETAQEERVQDGVIEEITRKEDEIKSVREEIRRTEEEIRRKEEAITRKKEEIRRKEEAINGVEEEIRRKEEAITRKKEEIRRKEEAINGVEEEIHKEIGTERGRFLEAKLEFLRQEILSPWQEIHSRHQIILSLRQVILSLRKEVLEGSAGPRASAMILRRDPMRTMVADISKVGLLPGIDELDSFLKTNPLPSGFPISSEYFRCLAPYDTKKLFTTADSEYFCKKLDSALAKVLDPPQTGSTEDSFHQFWDDLVNDFLQMFCNERIVRDRNTSRDRSSRNFRPDVIGQVEGEWALWRGEEKAKITVGDPSARKELLNKLTWVYGQVPYIFVYYARGVMVTLVALYMVEGTKNMRTLGTYNLSSVEGRVDIILACLNVARLIPRLTSLCEDYGVQAEFQFLSERGGKQVRLYGSSVRKLYLSQAVFDRVVKVYDLIRECPNSEQVVSSSLKDGEESWHSIVFRPRCGSQRPRSELELVMALVCVAKALVWLHERSIMHRDIRWPNIGHHDEAWFVLDFDEACTSPQPEAHWNLCCETHAPETPTGGHDCSVDIWGLGHLIQTSRILGLVPQLIKLRDRCLDRTPSSKPSARYCHTQLSDLISDRLV